MTRESNGRLPSSDAPGVVTGVEGATEVAEPTDPLGEGDAKASDGGLGP